MCLLYFRFFICVVFSKGKVLLEPYLHNLGCVGLAEGLQCHSGLDLTLAAFNPQNPYSYRSRFTCAFDLISNGLCGFGTSFGKVRSI